MVSKKEIIDYTNGMEHRTPTITRYLIGQEKPEIINQKIQYFDVEVPEITFFKEDGKTFDRVINFVMGDAGIYSIEDYGALIYLNEEVASVYPIRTNMIDAKKQDQLLKAARWPLFE